jgi:DNA uptake protein ComE-like DNA-binding protein
MHRSRITTCWQAAVLVASLGLPGCTTVQTTPQHEVGSQQAQDQRTREKVADATERAKERSQELGEKLDAAGQRLSEQARAVAQGVKEGLHRDNYPLNLNSAPESDLDHLPGLTREDARRIVTGRPYANTSDLVKKHILTEQQYRGVKDLVTIK